MRLVLQLCGYLVALPLEVLVLTSLIRGGWRRFPLVLAYSIAYFLTSVAEVPSEWAYLTGARDGGNWLSSIWYVDEAVMQVLVFAVVISLIYQATSALASRMAVRAFLIAGATLFVLISFFLHFDPAQTRGTWMTPWLRDLNLCATLLDLALWTLLIGSRHKDTPLLLLSGGLGVQFTGEAIGESLRQMASHTHSHALSFSGALVIVISDLACLYLWWQALRSEEHVQMAARAQLRKS